MIETSETTTLLPHMEFGTQRQSLSELYLLCVSWPKPHHYCWGGARPPNRTWDEFLPHTARAEDRGKFRRDGETQQLPVGAGISLWRSKSPPQKKPWYTIALALRVLSISSHFFRDRRRLISEVVVVLPIGSDTRPLVPAHSVSP